MSEEVISGSIAASERPVFQKLLDRMETGDVLIATKLDRLDRLDRNAMDVRQAVDHRGISRFTTHLTPTISAQPNSLQKYLIDDR